MLLLEHLPIFLGYKVCIGPWMFGVNGLTEVVYGARRMGADEILCVFYMRANVNQLTHLLAYGLVEIYQKCVFPFKERTDVIHIIIKKRALAICTLQSVPMHAPPLVMITDADILYQTLVTDCLPTVTLDRYCQSLQAIGSGYDTAITISLFLI